MGRDGQLLSRSWLKPRARGGKEREGGWAGRPYRPLGDSRCALGSCPEALRGQIPRPFVASGFAWRGEAGRSTRQVCIVAALIVYGGVRPFFGVVVESPGSLPPGPRSKRRLQMRLGSEIPRPQTPARPVYRRPVSNPAQPGGEGVPSRFLRIRFSNIFRNLSRRLWPLQPQGAMVYLNLIRLCMEVA